MRGLWKLTGHQNRLLSTDIIFYGLLKFSVTIPSLLRRLYVRVAGRRVTETFAELWLARVARLGVSA